MKRLEFIKKTGLATVGLPLLSSFELSKECLFVEDQVEREKFDFELYEKTHYGNLNFIRPNGNIVFVMSFSEEGGGTMEEIVNKYPFYTLYKEYYPDGYIKVQKTFIPDALAIGKSYYYDKEGRMTIVDEDKQYEGFKYTIDDVLLFLQEKKQLNIKEGTLWYNEKYRFAYSINYTKLKGKTLWRIKINNAIPFDMTNLNLCMFITLWMWRQGEYIQKRNSSKRKKKKQRQLPLSMVKPTPKKSGKPLSKNNGKSTKLNKDKKDFWERLFG